MEKKTFTGTIAAINQFLFKFNKNTVYDITIEKHRDKRSLNANNYAWKLITEIGNQLRMSKEEVYMQMLKDYGQREYICMLANVNPIEYQSIMKKQELESKMESYMFYVGTSQYNSKEMSIFIDGLVQEAKNLGIETLEDKELNEMIKEMEKYENN